MITTQIIFDHRGRSKAGHEGPVELRVTYDRKAYYLNTGIKVRGRELRDGKIIGRKDADVLNTQLENFCHRAMQAVNVCIEKKMPVNVAEIRRQAYNINTEDVEDKNGLIDWIEEQIPLLPISGGTKKRYDVLLHRMKEYKKLTAWSDLTVESLYLFDDWLHKLKRPQSNGDLQAKREPVPIKDSAVYNYHKALRALIHRAVRLGIVETNPYDRIRGEFRRGSNENVEFLTEAEIDAIESLRPMEGTQSAMARDLFIFQVYTGLSYSDAQAFDIADYKRLNGKWVHVGNRIKTGVPFVSQLLPQAVDVLERYGMQVPKVGNAQYNISLKVIQQALGISTRLHSHLARHTFATRALAMGVKIENVSRMLGHTNITQTQRYAKVLAESVRNEFDMMEKKLKK